jgi:NAD(P)H-flavin reductase/ferredoxin
MPEHHVEIAGKAEGFACSEDQSVLDAALRAGIPLRYGCGHGECGTCRAKVLAGEYELWDSASPFALLEHELDEGWTLLCSTTAYSDLVVDATLEDVGRPVIAPGGHRFEVVSNTAVSPGMRLLRAVAVDNGVRYYPGQYFELSLGAGRDKRAYSFASWPGGGGSEVAKIEFVVRLVPGGKASQRLAACPPGEILEISGPYGNMTLRQGSGPKVLVAGGSGIGPVRAIVQEILAGPPAEAVWLFHGARLRDELLWCEELTAAEREHPWFHYLPALSEPACDGSWSGCCGVISKVLGETLQAGEVAKSDSYVCGPAQMVRSVREVLLQMGSSEDHIFADEF